jgi:hypothetical protein
MLLTVRQPSSQIRQGLSFPHTISITSTMLGLVFTEWHAGVLTVAWLVLPAQDYGNGQYQQQQQQGQRMGGPRGGRKARRKRMKGGAGGDDGGWEEVDMEDAEVRAWVVTRRWGERAWFSKQ